MNGASRSCRPVFLPLAKAGLEVLVEQGAGLAAGFLDDQYVSKGGAHGR